MNKRTEQPIIADEQIIELYWQRNENAIQETDKKYGQFLFGIAYNILHDRLDCEECQNDTYLGVWNAIPPTRPILWRDSPYGIFSKLVYCLGDPLATELTCVVIIKAEVHGLELRIVLQHLQSCTVCC